MVITATELKTNLGKYLELVLNEDILITKNGKVIAQLTQPQFEKLRILNSLVGAAKSSEELSLDDIKSLRLKKR